MSHLSAGTMKVYSTHFILKGKSDYKDLAPVFPDILKMFLEEIGQTPEEEGQENDYGEGLGLLSGFDIEVHYEPSFLQLASMITDLKYRGRPIYALPNKGGMIVDGEKIMLLGDAFRIGPEDIDDIQATIDWVVREGKVSKFERIF